MEGERVLGKARTETTSSLASSFVQLARRGREDVVDVRSSSSSRLDERTATASSFDQPRGGPLLQDENAPEDQPRGGPLQNENELQNENVNVSDQVSRAGAGPSPSPGSPRTELVFQTPTRFEESSQPLDSDETPLPPEEQRREDMTSAGGGSPLKFSDDFSETDVDDFSEVDADFLPEVWPPEQPIRFSVFPGTAYPLRELVEEANERDYRQAVLEQFEEDHRNPPHDGAQKSPTTSTADDEDEDEATGPSSYATVASKLQRTQAARRDYIVVPRSGGRFDNSRIWLKLDLSVERQVAGVVYEKTEADCWVRQYSVAAGNYVDQENPVFAEDWELLEKMYKDKEKLKRLRDTGQSVMDYKRRLMRTAEKKSVFDGFNDLSPSLPEHEKDGSTNLFVRRFSELQNARFVTIRFHGWQGPGPCGSFAALVEFPAVLGDLAGKVYKDQNYDSFIVPPDDKKCLETTQGPDRWFELDLSDRADEKEGSWVTVNATADEKNASAGSTTAISSPPSLEEEEKGAESGRGQLLGEGRVQATLQKKEDLRRRARLQDSREGYDVTQVSVSVADRTAPGFLITLDRGPFDARDGKFPGKAVVRHML